MTPPTILLVLAKAPQAGLVKTRLCPPATPVQAARIAAAALLDTLDAIRAVPGTQPVVALSGELTEAESADDITRALRDIPVIRQRGNTLGERITAAHADVAARFPGSAVLQIGMDTPQVDPELLGRCVTTLGLPDTQAALGPASDGGWWALGLRDPLAASSITTVPTSREDTGANTADALRRHGLDVTALPELSDVDTATDAVAVAGHATGTRFAAAVREILL